MNSILVLAAAVSAAAALPDGFREPPEKYWDFAELGNAPAYRACDRAECAFKGMDALLVSGRGPNGSSAEFFCYFAKPEGAVPEGGFPGVLLVHGGGGTAFPLSVDAWRRAGFAVLAPDWYNCMPAPGLTNGSPVEGRLPRIELPGGRRNDQRANVANLVLAHSLLRSMTGVNSERTVYVGLSWGSWYGAAVAAVDPRFRGVVEIYCGDARPSDRLVNGRFLHAAKCPMWWVVGTNDQNVSPASSQAGFDECPTHFGHAIVPRLPHSHVGYEFGSVMRMAKFFAGAGRSLPVLGRATISEGAISARVERSGASEGRAVLNYTVDRSAQKPHMRRWLSAPAELKGGVVSAKLPDGVFQAYLSLYEADEGRFHDLCGSSSILEVRE